VTEDDARLLDIVRRDPRYPLTAFEFVRDAVTHASQAVHGGQGHVTGAELLESVRSLARERYGVLTPDVLESWGVRSTLDVGRIVFRLVDEGLLGKTDEDSLDDFRDVFSFEEAFRAADYWQDRLSDD
jgi:uncharacterized repeat protein (TIGR04138 family)